MAKTEKRPVKGPPVAAVIVPAPTECVEPTIVAPECCANCDISIFENNVGGFSVTHPGRGGIVAATITNTTEATDWLAITHAQEDNPSEETSDAGAA